MAQSRKRSVLSGAPIQIFISGSNDTEVEVPDLFPITFTIKVTFLHHPQQIPHNDSS